MKEGLCVATRPGAPRRRTTADFASEHLLTARHFRTLLTLPPDGPLPADSQRKALLPSQHIRPKYAKVRVTPPHARTRRPKHTKHFPNNAADYDLSSLSFMQSWSTTTAYNLSHLYSSLLEQGLCCRYLAGRTALYFELSGRNNVVPDLVLPPVSRPGRSPSNLKNRWCRSRSADALPPSVKGWVRTVTMSNSTRPKLECFVLASGVVVLWGLKPQLHVRYRRPMRRRASIDKAAKEWLDQKADNLRQEELGNLEQRMKENALWNAEVVSSASWFLSQFAEGRLRPDWDSEESLHYYEGLIEEEESGHTSTAQKRRARLFNDRLHLRTNEVEEKLAVSLAAGQSVVLGVFEGAIRSTVQSLDHSSEEVINALRGLTNDQGVFWNLIKWILETFDCTHAHTAEASHETLKELANLYLKVIDLNLVKKIVDVPEYFWEEPCHQQLWAVIHKYMEVADRVQILNSRCAWIKQLLTDLSHTRNELQETELTWICILWICAYILTLVVECVIERKSRTALRGRWVTQFLSWVAKSISGSH